MNSISCRNCFFPSSPVVSDTQLYKKKIKLTKRTRCKKRFYGIYSQLKRLFAHVVFYTIIKVLPVSLRFCQRHHNSHKHININLKRYEVYVYVSFLQLSIFYSTLFILISKTWYSVRSRIVQAYIRTC